MTTRSPRHLVLALALLLAISAAAQQDDSFDDLPHVLRAVNIALETGRSGTETRWNNPATGSYGVVVPAPALKSSAGQICRPFQRTRVSGGRTATYQGVACRGAGGRWTIREETAARSEKATAALRTTDRKTDARSEAPESTGHVAQAQRLLAEFGLEPGPIDGILGLRTKSAIEEFQRRKGMTVDGWLSKELLARLSAAQDAPSLGHAVVQTRAAALSEPAPCECRHRATLEKELEDAEYLLAEYEKLRKKYEKEYEARYSVAYRSKNVKKRQFMDRGTAARLKGFDEMHESYSQDVKALAKRFGRERRYTEISIVRFDADACKPDKQALEDAVAKSACRGIKRAIEAHEAAHMTDICPLGRPRQELWPSALAKSEVNAYRAQSAIISEELAKLRCESYKLQITGTLTYGHSGLGGRVSERMEFQIYGGMSEQSQERSIQGTFSYKMSGAYSYASAYNPCRWSRTYSGDGTIRGEIKQGADGMKGLSLTLQHESGSLLRHEEYGWCAGWLPLELSEKLVHGIQFEAAVPSSGPFPYAQNVMGNVDHTHVSKYGKIEVTYALEPASAVPAAAWK